MSVATEIIDLFERRGSSQYGGESVTQLEHALQAATLAEQEGASIDLIVAALLHDVGHLLHDLPADAPDQGVDDHHETSGCHYLQTRFPTSVVEPARLHVAAKRYLCSVDAEYLSKLSQPSVVSLQLQGGVMNEAEIAQFEQNPFAQDATRLRKWDDIAKDPNFVTPPLTHFANYLPQVAFEEAES